MFSLTRFLVIVGIYVAFVLVISLTLPTTNPSLFVILLLVALGALFYVLFFARDLLADPKRKRLLALGRDAPALILHIADTGITLNQNPYVRLRLQVQPPDTEPYEVTVSALVSRVNIPRVGEVIMVKYDPARPQEVILP